MVSLLFERSEGGLAVWPQVRSQAQLVVVDLEEALVEPTGVVHCGTRDFVEVRSYS